MNKNVAYGLAFILHIAYSFPPTREQTATAGDTSSAQGMVPTVKARERVASAHQRRVMSLHLQGPIISHL